MLRFYRWWVARHARPTLALTVTSTHVTYTRFTDGRTQRLALTPEICDGTHFYNTAPLLRQLNDMQVKAGLFRIAVTLAPSCATTPLITQLVALLARAGHAPHAIAPATSPASSRAKCTAWLALLIAPLLFLALPQAQRTQQPVRPAPRASLQQAPATHRLLAYMHYELAALPDEQRLTQLTLTHGTLTGKKIGIEDSFSCK